MVMCAMSSATPASGALSDRRSSDVIVTHPNRDKPVVQSTRATVILLLLVTVGLLLVITVSGWNVFESAVPIQIAYIVVYLTLAFFAGRWNRGVLPVGSALAVLLGIFALVAAPGWFERDKTGFEAPNYLNASLLGLLTLLIVPLQVLLVLFAMRGFQQGWNVEVERSSGAPGTDIHGDPAAQHSVRRIPSRPT
jgi:presenilin-like A22 family membrane protease